MPPKRHAKELVGVLSGNGMVHVTGPCDVSMHNGKVEVHRSNNAPHENAKKRAPKTRRTPEEQELHWQKHLTAIETLRGRAARDHYGREMEDIRTTFQEAKAQAIASHAQNAEIDSKTLIKAANVVRHDAEKALKKQMKDEYPALTPPAPAGASLLVPELPVAFASALWPSGSTGMQSAQTRTSDLSMRYL